MDFDKKYDIKLVDLFFLMMTVLESAFILAKSYDE